MNEKVQIIIGEWVETNTDIDIIIYTKEVITYSNGTSEIIVFAGENKTIILEKGSVTSEKQTLSLTGEDNGKTTINETKTGSWFVLNNTECNTSSTAKSETSEQFDTLDKSFGESFSNIENSIETSVFFKNQNIEPEQNIESQREVSIIIIEETPQGIHFEEEVAEQELTNEQQQDVIVKGPITLNEPFTETSEEIIFSPAQEITEQELTNEQQQDVIVNAPITLSGPFTETSEENIFSPTQEIVCLPIQETVFSPIQKITEQELKLINKEEYVIFEGPITLSRSITETSEPIQEITVTSNIESKNNIFIPTKCTNDVKSNDQISLGSGPMRIEGGTISYTLASDDSGDVIYSFYSDQEDSVKDNDEKVIVSYNYTNVRGEGTAQFITTKLSKTPEGITKISGCSGWWINDKVDIMDLSDNNTQWSMNNCKVVDPKTQEKHCASNVNFNTLRGQTMKYGSWICNTKDGEFEFNFDTCVWVKINNIQDIGATLLINQNQKNTFQNVKEQTKSLIEKYGLH